MAADGPVWKTRRKPGPMALDRRELTALEMKGERVAVVTGGGSGIGRAAAVALSQDRWSVVVAGRG